MMKIKLYGPKAVGDLGHMLVDDEDYPKLSPYRWKLTVAIDPKAPNGREAINIFTSIKKKTVSVHRMIMGFPEDLQVDHIDHNRFNNQKSNLRIATHGENTRNRRSALNSKSKFLGVGWDKHKGKWRADITSHGVGKFLGNFINEVEAAEMYDLYAAKYHKEFANLNFPEKLEYYQSKFDEIDINKRRTNASIYKGVYLRKERNTWIAKHIVKRKEYYIGSFKEEIDAAKAYDKYVIENNLDTELLNFPENKS